MKLLFYVFLSILFVGLFSCRNNKILGNTDSTLSNKRLVIEYRTLEGNLNDTTLCLESSVKDKLNRERFYFVEQESNQIVPQKNTNDYFYIYDKEYNTILTEEDENYRIYIFKHDIITTNLVFEDKKTGQFYYTLFHTIRGVYKIKDSYWIVGNGSYYTCNTDVSIIKNPKNLPLLEENNINDVHQKISKISEEKIKKIKESSQEIDNLYSCDLWNHDLRGFIPYKNSMILFMIGGKKGNIKSSILQINEDKKIDTLFIDSPSIKMPYMYYEICTILPKNQNSISFCNSVLEIENDTLFIYSLE